jgi:hypothetical protein
MTTQKKIICNIAVLLLSVSYLNAQKPNRLLTYDGFDINPTIIADDKLKEIQMPYINNIGSGIGWSSKWRCQDFKYNLYKNGFMIARKKPLSYKKLKINGNFLKGGYNYTSCNRTLDIEKSFSKFLIEKNKEKYIGKNNTNIWISFLIRKDKKDLDKFFLAGVTGNYSQQKETIRFAVGFFGNQSIVNSLPVWSLCIRNSSNTDFDVIKSKIPIVKDKVTFIVLNIKFGEKDTCNLYINPKLINRKPPHNPNVKWTTDGKTDIIFKTIGIYGGTKTNQISIDEIRIGESFKSVTPYK